MTTIPANENSADLAAPLNNFSQCHAGILSQLDRLSELPALMAAAERARVAAAGTLEIFKHAVTDHHVEEEADLFPAVLRSATPDERDLVQAMVNKLTSEHRTVEALWKRVEPAISAASKGKPAEADAALVAELVRAYRAHARFEEEQFLPLAEKILGRNGNHMAALGMSLHMRHVPAPIGYI